MPEPKAQLVDPQGPIDVPGLQVTGVTTATGGFVGNVQGAATGLASTTTNLNVGIVTATKFSGNTTGTVSGLADDTNINVGIITSTSFTGDLVGNAAGLSTTTANIKAGIMSATSFAGNFTGVASGITGTPNIVVGIMTGTLKGDGSSLTGIAATNFITNNVTTTSATTYAITVGHSGSSAYTLSGNDRNGSVSGSNAGVAVNVGDTLNFAVSASGHPFYIRVSNGGANVSTPAATNQGTQSGTVSWTPNTAGTYYYQCGNHSGMIGTITVSDSTTSINLSDGNVIYFTQNVDTTVSFANTGTSNIVTFIRVKDSSATERTLTWPSAIKWDGGNTPTLITDWQSGDANIITLLTRDEGVTWYGWESFSKDTESLGLFGWGNNPAGELGQNNTVKYSSPVQLGSSVEWAYGGTTEYSLFSKQDGTLWSWGKNEWGQSAQNNVVQYSSPVQIPGTTWASDSYFSVMANPTVGSALKTDGTLWMWGNNYKGKLAQTHNPGYSSPVQVGSDTTWKTAASVGNYFTTQAAFATKTDGTAWAWGSTAYGQLGLNQGGPGPSGSTVNYSSPTQIPGTTWDRIEQSASETLAFGRKTDGTLWVWGYSPNGRFGIPSKATGYYSSPTQIPGTNWSDKFSCTGHSVYAVKTDGTLWAWGNNNQGHLGQNNKTQYSSPTQIPGTTWVNVRSLSNGAVAKKTDGTLWAWGYNENAGQLGQNNLTEYSSPVQIPGTTWNRVMQSGGGKIFASKKDY